MKEFGYIGSWKGVSMKDAGSPKNSSELESMEVAESARQETWAQPSFLRDLFLGKFNLSLIHPHPEPDPEEEARADEFLYRLEHFMRTRVDSDAIDREGTIPEELVEELRQMGLFGIKIPREYGGLGFSKLTYIRANELISSQDANVAALLSAHPSRSENISRGWPRAPYPHSP